TARSQHSSAEPPHCEGQWTGSLAGTDPQGLWTGPGSNIMLGGDHRNGANGADMQLIVYEPVKADKEAFVEFWSGRYTGYDDEFYKANVGQELTEERILLWFEWKNGRRLSEKKRRSVLDNFVARRSELDQKHSAEELLARYTEDG